MRTQPALLFLLLLLLWCLPLMRHPAWASPTEAWLSASDATTMENALAPFYYGPKVSDYSDDYSVMDYGSTLNLDFSYGGPIPTQSEGSFKLEVVGQIVSPTGATVQNNAVGVQGTVYGKSAFWVLIQWFSTSPMPNWAALPGITVSATGPFQGHF